MSISFRRPLEGVIDSGGNTKDYITEHIPVEVLRGRDTGMDVLKALVTADGTQAQAVGAFIDQVTDVFKRYQDLGIRPVDNKRIKIYFDNETGALRNTNSNDAIELVINLGLPRMDSLGKNIDYYDQTMAMVLDLLQFKNQRLAEAEQKIKQVAALANLLQQRVARKGEAYLDIDPNLAKLPGVRDVGYNKLPKRPSSIDSAPFATKEEAVWKMIYAKRGESGGPGFIALLQEIGYHPSSNNYGMTFQTEFLAIQRLGESLTELYTPKGREPGWQAGLDHRDNIATLFSKEGMFGTRALNPPVDPGNPLNFQPMSKVKSTEAYVDGITDFEQAYVAMRNLALDLDREISNRIKDEVLRAAGKSLRKMVSGDDPGNVLAREFLLHNVDFFWKIL